MDKAFAYSLMGFEQPRKGELFAVFAPGGCIPDGDGAVTLPCPRRLDVASDEVRDAWARKALLKRGIVYRAL